MQKPFTLGPSNYSWSENMVQLSSWATPLPRCHSQSELTQKSDPKWKQGGGLYPSRWQMEKGRTISALSCFSTRKTSDWPMKDGDGGSGCHEEPCLPRSNNLIPTVLWRWFYCSGLLFSPPLQKLLLISVTGIRLKNPHLFSLLIQSLPLARNLIKWNISLFQFAYVFWSWNCHLEWVLGSGQC